MSSLLQSVWHANGVIQLWRWANINFAPDDDTASKFLNKNVEIWPEPEANVIDKVNCNTRIETID